MNGDEINRTLIIIIIIMETTPSIASSPSLRLSVSWGLIRSLLTSRCDAIQVALQQTTTDVGSSKVKIRAVAG